jgi:GNAT superfamily N-acetyltransferase
VPQLARLHAEAMAAGMALGAAPGTDRDGLERRHREALAEPCRIVLVAERDGQVVGMAHLAPSGAANAPHRAEVQRVAVAARVRGRGVGRQLMASVEEAALDRGLTLLWLTTHDGSDACAFYEAVGYTKLGVMPGYSLRPDGTLSPGAFYCKELRRSS